MTIIHRHFILAATLAIPCAAGLQAGDDPFVGTWKMNLDKSQITGQQMQIKDLGGGKYDWIYGDDDVPIVADGADHPSKFGGTLSLKQEGPDRWILTYKHDGKVTAVSTWTLTDGGQQWNIDRKETRPDGSTFTESETAARVGVGSGFIGTWELKGIKASGLTDWVIKAYGTDGLSFTTPAYKQYQDIKFDGKDYPDHGPRVAPGSTSSAKRIDEHTIQMTDKLKGEVMDTEELKVSEDGRTLTMTVHPSGVEKPQIFVFDKL